MKKLSSQAKLAVIGSYKAAALTSQLIYLVYNFNVMAELPSFPEEYTANKAKIATTPVALRSFEKMQEVHEKGYMNSDFLATTYEGGDENAG